MPTSSTRWRPTAAARSSTCRSPSTSTRPSRWCAARRLQRRRRAARGAAAPIPGILGQAPAMQDVFRAIGRLSRSSLSVLVTGESGTGKELVARALAPAQPARQRAVHRAQHLGHRRRSCSSPSCSATRRARSPARTPAPRPLRAGRRRHAVPGRDRRHEPRAADAAAARAGRRRVLSRRRQRAACASTCA